MATVRKWSNVAIAMQSAIGAAQTITGITKASPGVVTTSGTLPSNGAYVLMTIQGMHQVNGRVFRVAGAAGATFQLEGEDTTDFDTFSTGSFQVVTLGTSITTATGVSSSGGGFQFIDTTTIHANQKSQVPGLPDAATYTLENIWDISDAGLLAMKSASDAQTMKVFKFTFGTGGQIMVFAGYVGANLLPGGSAQDKVTTSAAITMHGSPSYYSS